MDPKLNRIWWVLRVGLGVIAVVAGADKFLHLLTDWSMYLSSTFANMLPVSTETFMYAAGVVEILVGVAILTKLTRIGAYVMSAWLLAVSVNLLMWPLYDIAVRDIAMALAAFSLAQLTEVLHGVHVPERERRFTHRHAHAAT